MERLKIAVARPNAWSALRGPIEYHQAPGTDGGTSLEL